MGGLFVLAAADGQLRLRVELRIWELGGGQWEGSGRGPGKEHRRQALSAKVFSYPGVCSVIVTSFFGQNSLSSS